MGRNSKRRGINGRTYRGTSLDKFLSEKRLKRKHIAKDGSCLFRAVSEQVCSSQCSHQDVRLRCAEYIRAHQDDFKEFITVSIEEYISHLIKELWGGEMELVVLSRLYNRSIVVYNEQSGRKTVQEELYLSLRDEKEKSGVDRLTNPILLAYSDGNHYDSVCSIQHMNDLAFCQGILYTMLMERVFKDNIPHLCKKKMTQLQDSEVETIAKYSREKYSTGLQQKDYECRTLRNLSRHYEPDMVVAMSWTLHYNTALSVHRREKAGIEQRDRDIAASIQFHVGDKCLFLDNGSQVTGEIVVLNTKPGLHLVRVSHSDEKWEVPVNDVMLVSSQMNNSKQAKSHQHSYQAEPYSANPKNNGRSRQSKDKSGPIPPSSSSGGGSTSEGGGISSLPLSPVSTTVATGTTSTTSFPFKKGSSTNTVRTERVEDNPWKKPNPPPSAIDKQTQKSRFLVKSNLASKNGAGLPGNPPSSDAHSGGSVPPLQPSPRHTATATATTFTKTTAYSSAVKKTSGGPSGSLTSEGTEYESSGEEGPPQEENETGHSIPGKFPLTQQRQQQQVWQPKLVKPAKPLSSPRGGTVGGGGGVLTGNGYSGEGHGSPSTVHLSAVEHNRLRQDGSSPLVGVEGRRCNETVPPPPSAVVVESAQRQGEQDSPYLKRQIPQSSSPSDSWPHIDGHKEELPGSSDAIPPANTMIYAAIMTNRANQGATPIVPVALTTSPRPIKEEFPASAILSMPPPPKTSFPHTFNMEQMDTGTSTTTAATISTSSSLPSLSTLPLMYAPSTHHVMAQSSNNSLSNSLVSSVHAGLGLSTAVNSPPPLTHIMRTTATHPHNQHHNHHHHQFDNHPISSHTLPSSAFVVSRGGGGGGQSYGYQSVPVNREHTTTSQLYPSPSSYGVGRSNEEFSSTSTPVVSLPFTTVAAGKEMRNLLGIDGNHMMSSPPIYTEGGGGGGRDHHQYQHQHHTLLNPNTVPVVSKPVTMDIATQTTSLQLSSCSKEIQVGPADVVARGVQTVDCCLHGKEDGTQTEGVYVSVQDISPPPRAHNMEYIGDVINFALRYSLHCLSVSNSASASATPAHNNDNNDDDDNNNDDLVTSLNEILKDNLMEGLFHRANEYDKIQREMLSVQSNHMLNYQQFGGGETLSHLSPVAARMFELPGGSGGGGGPVDQDMTPQQEQHLPSPGVPGGIPKLPALPNFPMMIHPRPPPPPFMLPHHGHMPMYYPIMPPPAMGYMPFMVPPPLPHHQVATPHQVVTPLPAGVGEIIVEDQLEGHNDRSVCVPNMGLLMQEQGDQKVEDGNSNPPSQITTTTTTTTTTALPSNQPQSEMVASSVYPIPPSAMSHAEPPISISVLPPQVKVQSNLPPCDDPPSIMMSSPDTIVAGGNHTEDVKQSPDRPETPKDDLTITQKLSPSHRRSHQPKPSLPDQPHHQRGHRNARRSLPTNSGPSNPSLDQLPCRPSLHAGSQVSSRGKYSQAPRGQGDGNKRGTSSSGGGGSIKKLEAVSNLKTDVTMNSVPDEAGGGGEEKKEHSTKKTDYNENLSRTHSDRNQRSNSKGSSGGGKKQRYGATGKDHSGSSTVTGPSPTSRKPNQDHNRAFSSVYDNDDDDHHHKATSTTRTAGAGGGLDTINFPWGVPSPNQQPDVIGCSALHSNSSSSNGGGGGGGRSNNDTYTNSQVEKTEWPDFSESTTIAGSPACERKSYSVGLKFVFDDNIINDSSKKIEFSDTNEHEEKNNNNFTETVEDPFDIDTLPGAWNSDVGDFPLDLTLSISSPQFQGSLLHAQCTGDLSAEGLDQKRGGNRTS